MQDASGLGSLLCFPGIAERIATHLPHNDVPCGMRLVCKATAALLKGKEHTTVRVWLPTSTDEFARRWGRPGAARGLSERQRNKLVVFTVRTGSLANVKVAVEACGLLTPASAWSNAACNGHLHICKWLQDQSVPFDKNREALSLAARNGHRRVCEWLLLEAGYPWTPDALNEALKGGRMELAEWLLEQRPGGPAGTHTNATGRRQVLSGALAGAAYSLPLVKFQRLYRELTESLDAAAAGDSTANTAGTDGGERQQPAASALRALALREGDEPLSEEQRGSVVAGAASSRTPDWRAKVEWLEAEGFPKTPESSVKAAACANALERLRWLRGRGYPLGEGAVKEAAENGDMDVLQYLLTEGAPSGAEVVSRAVHKGRLAALQALHAAGKAKDALAAALNATRRGHMNILLWLVDESGLEVQLSHRLLGRAVQSGNIDMVKWLRQWGCSWEPEDSSRPPLLKLAAHGGHQPTIELMVEQGCPIPDDGVPFISAATHGDMATLRYLRQLAVPWGATGDTFKRCVEEGVRPEVLRWLVAEGCPVAWPSVLAAARARRRQGSPELVTCLEAEYALWKERPRQLLIRLREEEAAAATAPSPVVSTTSSLGGIGNGSSSDSVMSSEEGWIQESQALALRVAALEQEAQELRAELEARGGSPAPGPLASHPKGPQPAADQAAEPHVAPTQAAEEEPTVKKPPEGPGVRSAPSCAVRPLSLLAPTLVGAGVAALSRLPPFAAFAVAATAVACLTRAGARARRPPPLTSA
ncbi:hypothetical protein GPECTOR_11g287 [Gonium pectorale]|uniref:Uncharacterized protein n=1 Tax=Gonium pectorale TaxID=33097 RepID=A0A150GQ32_GONPE|nr:hypothetical protein GPECTOR_11g287 [Gonium pectorale]|eukprot:KXZ51848.1 hypothetical protein GPECTOR_11g287 [Gonium pectorale]